VCAYMCVQHLYLYTDLLYVHIHVYTIHMSTWNWCAKFVYFIHTFPTNTHRIGQCCVRVCIHDYRQCSVVCVRIRLHGIGQCSVVCARVCVHVYTALGHVLWCVLAYVLWCAFAYVYMVLVSVLWCVFVYAYMYTRH